MASQGYGYDEEFVDVPPDYLKCIVCHLVLRDPIQLIECGHHYCSGCFERIKGYSNHFNSPLSCPIDRQVIHLTKVMKDKFAERIISDLHVKCSFTSCGCTWVGELRNIEAHRSECVHATREDSSQESRCSASEAGTGSTELFSQIFERIEICEIGLQEKDKDVAFLKFQLKETKDKLLDKDEEVDQLKQKLLKNEEVVQCLKKDFEMLKILYFDEEIENLSKSVDVRDGNEAEESKVENKETKKKKKKKKKKKTADGTQNCEGDINVESSGVVQHTDLPSPSSRSVASPSRRVTFQQTVLWQTRVSSWEYHAKLDWLEISPVFGPCCSEVDDGSNFRLAIELLIDTQKKKSIRLDFETAADNTTFCIDIELLTFVGDDDVGKTKKVCSAEVITQRCSLSPTTWWGHELCEIDEDVYKAFVDEHGVLGIVCNYTCQHSNVVHIVL